MAKIIIETGRTNPILRERSTEVKLSELKQYLNVIQDMLRYIKDTENGGVGLAAPQIGLNKRIIVVSLMQDYEDEQYKTIAMINPEIIEHSEEKCTENEGCLSIPGESGEVSRWCWVKVRFMDMNGRFQILKLEKLAGRILQHEMDHIDGILFVDRVEEKIMMVM